MAATTQINETPLNYQARKRLRMLREKLALSRPKFAALLDMPQTTLKNYELGYREIGGGFFLAIANHNQLTEHAFWLMTGTQRSPLFHVE
ncbi:transcriptional regulator with XRE-family HTH domain [Aeromonas hydrophila]|nr:transcriptional regulator with XRE-family HTH domain [Aeromonas hydrophila]MCS3791519.1 transcriptional regulator with XRE-family HTH domain [Aeromonas hydrophila]